MASPTLDYRTPPAGRKLPIDRYWTWLWGLIGLGSGASATSYSMVLLHSWGEEIGSTCGTGRVYISVETLTTVPVLLVIAGVGAMLARRLKAPALLARLGLVPGLVSWFFLFIRISWR